MNFIFSRGFDLSSVGMECIYPGRLLADKCVQDDAVAIIFDGQSSSQGRFAHSMLNDDFVESSESGVFCFGRVPLRGTAIFRTDSLGQYPLYYSQTSKGYALSNDIFLLKRTLEANGVRPTPSCWPAAENMVFGGVLGTQTHYDEIKRVPYGVFVAAADTLQFPAASGSDRARSYDEAIHEAQRSIGAHIASVPEESLYVADLTGGGDSRLVLSFLLESGLKFAGRCLTQHPHPDGNVAAFLMDKFGIPAGPYPTPQSPIEARIRINAGICGGARDVGFGVPSTAFTNFVHFRGLFGEIAGATPGVDYITEADGSAEIAVDLLLARRKMARAYNLLTGGAVQEIRTRLIAHYSELCAQYPVDNVSAESYLRTRCRTHFGLLAYIDNRTRICPDPLANAWLVEARRCLPGFVHRKNKVVLDLMRLQRAELLYLPMAGSKWAREIVPETDLFDWDSMQVITIGSEPLSEMTGPLALSIAVPGVKIDRVLPINATQGTKVHPHDIYVEPFQTTLGFVLDSLAPGHDFWTVFDRRSVELYIDRAASEFAASGIDTHAMGILAASAMSTLGLGVGLPELPKSQLTLGADSERP